MNKKEQIKNLFKEGKSIEEMVALGFNKKYILQIIRECKNNGLRSNENQIKDDEQLNSKRQIDDQEDRNYEYDGNEQFILNNMNDIEQLLICLKENIQNISDIEFKVKLSWKNGRKKSKKSAKYQINNESIMNPIDFYRDNGVKELEDALYRINLEELKIICKQYAPDPRGYAYKWKDKKKIINYIIQRVGSLAKNGSVFYTVNTFNLDSNQSK
ncbi:hypothetical protein Q428_07150 [Fervidicella metallireducens AeB]|uniref:Uncharacterized protein n=1 Tax=Fervidicella metallireducens AeB TaxID=1403537 RepID=A0A017RXI1_9CLOT|nr:hypothetical protein [Fervidicella metallireducens]EYE88630.1 hypothetical protein Q428_07150 [Fervidicella metallireducens AeB]